MRAICLLWALALFLVLSEALLKNLLFFFSIIMLFHITALGQNYRVGRKLAQNQSEKDSSTPKTGRQKATEYFKADADKQVRGSSSSSSVGSEDHYLAVHLSGFMQTETWRWGQTGKEKGTGKTGFGVTYRFQEWGQTDLNVRFEINEYKVIDQKPLKFSIMPVIIFPEAGAQFPLYFGAGAGLGVFFKQVEKESSVSFDYQLFMGARFFNVAGSSGFFIETGLKNHIHILSDGQFNGTYLSLGAVFTF